MNDSSWIILGANALTLLTAAIGVIASIRNGNKIQEVHMTINGRLTEYKSQTDKLLLASVVAAHADGKAEGVAETKQQVIASAGGGKNGS